VKVIGVDAFGGPDSLRPFEVPVPEPGPGEVRIRVHAAAVNPTDLSFRAGTNPQALSLGDREPPFVPGIDLAGVIDGLGTGADSRLGMGDRVVAMVLPAAPRGGAYAEYVVAPAASVVPAPRDVSFAAASTLLLNGVTAQLALNATGLSAGRSVAITGAAGALGNYAVALAHSAGLHVIADAAPADRDLVSTTGADVIVERGPESIAAIGALVPGGAPAVIDGANLTEAVLPAVADGGSVISVKGWNGPTPRGIRIHPINALSASADTTLLARLVELADTGVLTLRVADVLPADRAPEAHRRLARGGTRGRLVLSFT
jgi:NADPH2:quinone reductase